MTTFGSVLTLDTSLGIRAGFLLIGKAGGDQSGRSVAGAGDVNGDGFDDLLIGAPLNDATGTTSGAAYVVYGRAGGLTGQVDLSALDGTTGFRITGGIGEEIGTSVAGLGDVNGDGFADILVGGKGAGPDNRGISAVIFGTDEPQPASLALSSLDGTTGFQMSGLGIGARTGAVLGAAGDVNGDGFDDFIVAGLTLPGNAGAGGAYVVFGAAGGFAATLSLSALDGTNGFRIPGLLAGDDAGRAVSTAGDINGDGYDDLLVGAPATTPNGTESGSAYVIFGRAAGFAADFDLDTLTGQAGFVVTGAAAFDALGVSVAAAGDVNGDGFEDFILGADRGSVGLSEPGKAYVIFGKAHWSAAELDVSSLTGGNGFAIQGEANNHQLGFDVSSAGDLNGDGFDDLLVGAPHAAEGAFNGGSAYVVFGAAGGFSATVLLAGLNGTNGFQLRPSAALESAGFSVASAGDLNGDGFDDIIVGAPDADQNGANSGTSYVIYGKATRATAGADLLSATDADDRLSGLGGRDTLLGFDGDDVLAGGAGDDLLDAGLGADSLYGGAGNDRFVTNDSRDMLVGSSGVDEALSSAVSLNLGATRFSGIEDATLTGTLTLNLTGTVGANGLTGNAGANMINGGGGGDRMAGGAGNDTYVTDGSDLIMEAAGEGRDTVRSSVTHVLDANLEALVLTGSANTAGMGNDLANSISGNAANNTVNGMLGADVLTGGAGRDTFVFSTAPAGGNVDRITDFVAADDTIRLDGAVFAGLSPGRLTAAAFVITTGAAALDAGDRIIYQSTTGRLYHDSDGTGAAVAVHFATLTPNLALTTADFVVF